MAEGSAPLARIDHLSVDVGSPSRRVVDDVSFDCSLGPDVVLLGANGSGKTTLLMALAGVVARTGRVTLPEPVGLLVQDPSAAWLTNRVADEVAFGLRSSALPYAEVKRHVADTLAKLGLSGFAGRNPRRLSGGEQQRVQLAALLVGRPRTLLIDEPGAHLDPATTREFADALSAWTPVPELVIRSSHDPASSLGADQLLVLDAGRLVASGPPLRLWGAGDLPVSPPALVSVSMRLIACGRLASPLPRNWAELAARVPA